MARHDCEAKVTTSWLNGGALEGTAAVGRFAAASFTLLDAHLAAFVDNIEMLAAWGACIVGRILSALVH